MAGRPYFTDAERAGLALAEAATRLADPVPGEIFYEAASTTTSRRWLPWWSRSP